MTTKLPSESSAQPLLRRERAARPQRRRFSRDEYYRMAELGLFRGERVELINGEIVEKSPQGLNHGDAIVLLTRLLTLALGRDFAVRVQLPLSLGRKTEPEPDVAVLRGTGLATEGKHPSTADLVIEVAESSLAYDRTTKATLYAKAGIPEYWVINLVNRQLEVRRDPRLLQGSKSKHAYAQTTLYAAGDTVSPLCAPELQLAVSEMLP